jgi:hypothetical protein
MKKVFILFCGMLLTTFLAAQQIEREMVIVEIGTGTWCQYCPGAAMGADDLIANGHDCAIVEYHNNDPFANTYSNARNTYYGITGYPTAKFDGILTVVGGNHTQSMYPSYLPKYNQRKAIPSSFKLQIFGDHVGLDYNITLIAEKVATTTSTSITLHFVVTESHIAYSWQGMSEVNFVERSMVPNQNGTTVDFSSNPVQMVNLTFSLSASWNANEIEFVSFLQDLTTKEVLQGTKVGPDTLLPNQNYNAGVSELNRFAHMNCSGKVAPRVTITNFASQALTTLDINYRVNQETLNTYAWTGNLTYQQSATVDLPEINFTVLDSNNLQVYTNNPNGNPDEDPSNDTIAAGFTNASVITPKLFLILKLDGNPDQTTWDIRNSEGTVIHSGGPYPNQPNQFIKDTLEFTDGDCYTFTINDSGGDGLCCTNGQGYYRLNNEANQLIYTNAEFGFVDMVDINVLGVGIMETSAGEPLVVSPNPFDENTLISFTLKASSRVNVDLFDMTGNKVKSLDLGYLPAGLQQVRLSSENLRPGVYLMNLRATNEFFSSKITVVK